MITISINEQPLIDAKNSVLDTGVAVKNKFNEVKEKVGYSHAKATYYSSIAANLSSYMFGFTSNSHIASLIAFGFSLDTFVNQAVKGGVPSEDKKLAKKAIANFAINVLTGVFNMPTAKLALTAYNCMSDHITVSVKA